MQARPLRHAAAATLLAAASVPCGACFNAPQAKEAIRRSRALEVRGHFQTIAVAATSYATQEGKAPEAEDIHALAAILEPTYVRVMPRTDPWGEDYWFAGDGTTWTLSSAGRDGQWDTADDVEMVDGQLTKMPGDEHFKD